MVYTKCIHFLAKKCIHIHLLYTPYVIHFSGFSQDLQECPHGSFVASEHLYECLGLDSLINKDVARKIANKRRAHLRNVLKEQSLQKQEGVNNYMMLATVSAASSQWSCDRASKLALAYSQLV